MKITVKIISGLFWMSIILAYPSFMFGQSIEVCDNAIDDDGDGNIDLNDTDCICEISAPVSLIPNPSFENVTCCPESIAELSCAEGWKQASIATTDLIHDCGWDGFLQFPVPRPFPDGQGVVGFRDGRSFDNSDEVQANWKEYAGACLTAPLLAGETYRFEFYLGFVSAIISPIIDFTFFGTSSCENLPYDLSEEEFGCPSNAPNWKKLSSVRIGRNRGWYKVKIEVTPTEDIHAIAIGPPCEATTAKQITYYFLDKLVLDERDDFTWIIGEDGHPCNNDFALFVVDKSNHSYQWYKEGIALHGENSARIEEVSEGDYQLRIVNDQGCISTAVYSYFTPVIEEEMTVAICTEGSYKFGDRTLKEEGKYEHTFVSAQGCDSIVYLTLETLATTTDTLYAKIFIGSEYIIDNQSFREEGEHIVKLSDSLGCDYFLHLFLDHYQVYWPNTFSPNNDGNNDYFKIYGGTELVNIKELTFFNRWGGKVSSKSNILPNDGVGWDGRSEGDAVEAGVYVFQAVVELVNGLENIIFGSVMVIR
jgi:gliding motility-associated-like protein